jgi:curved DNA-binding protein CbpA
MKSEHYRKHEVSPTPDYYAVLGVAQNATPEVIKAAYRRAALQNHPDRNQNDPQAEMRTKLVFEAYAVLSDVEKRKTYDQFARATVTPDEMDSDDSETPKAVLRERALSAFQAPFENTPTHPLKSAEAFATWLGQAQTAGITRAEIERLTSDPIVRSKLIRAITNRIGAEKPASRIAIEHQLFARVLELWKHAGVNVEAILTTPQVSFEIQRVSSLHPSLKAAIETAYMNIGWRN